KYSIAKYAGNKLIKHFGDYNFPTFLRSFPTPSSASSFIDFEGYNHYYYKKTNNAVIILSTKNKTWYESITSFSYVFSFWGLLLVILILFSGSKIIASNALTLAFKIQFVLVLMVVLSLLLFGTGSGIFVGRQYQSFTDRIISEKLHSIEEELRGKVSNYNTLNLESNGNYLENVLLKLSKVFVTDLNIYDPNGYLIASSRPKIFNLGLLGEQINPLALNELKLNNKSFFSHREEIGKLSYISSYLPLYNSEGKLLGYTNLQHFGQQRDFEDQIQQFIVAIINVFILLLAISIIISLIVSNWLTAPLRVLSEKVAALKFGGENEKIAYEGTDEIGTIVRAYNLKLEELEEVARQLAKSERESAWREMAKQVAHEIKNPLTPMKLGIQHLMRSYDPNVEGAKEKLERVFNSLIEQIDGLTRIANEFSNFAKMPEPNKQLCDLMGIIRNTLTLFEMEANNKIHLESNAEELLVNIDKNQWIQVFNNLLKNAIQALVGREDGMVTINISKDESGNSALIQISDTGCGISDEQKEKIFIPHFTTKSTGSGIGLSVVKQIIENHGGSIYFESVENEGTTFTVILPLE
ncbi:MAG: GHKL domain-containing protein, partial [Crocinitomicaceae bacterium]|nr:GHKL domain-containing protein [Crocinitomicaceae bacterium]